MKRMGNFRGLDDRCIWECDIADTIAEGKGAAFGRYLCG
jgi:hypothetical protein